MEWKTRVFAVDDAASWGRMKGVKKTLTELSITALICQEREIRLCCREREPMPVSRRGGEDGTAGSCGQEAR
jgi:hypothetical protein